MFSNIFWGKIGNFGTEWVDQALSQLTFTCSKLAIERLDSIVDFKQVNVSWIY